VGRSHFESELACVLSRGRSSGDLGRYFLGV
jgi:hypothetical protein